jgi:hypothetical protein
MSKGKKFEEFTTPAGEAVWPWLTRPDTKFNPDGEYRAKLILSGSDPWVAKMMQTLDGFIEAAVQDAKEKKPTKKNKIQPADPPYEMVVDEDGNETGEVLFSFKQKAKIKKKDGTVIEVTVPLFDAKANQVRIKGYVGNGSVLKIRFAVIPYFMESTNKAGVSLRLKGVQILELVTNEANAEAYGFGEEEGFEGETLPEGGVCNDVATETEDASDF